MYNHSIIIIIIIIIKMGWHTAGIAIPPGQVGIFSLSW